MVSRAPTPTPAAEPRRRPMVPTGRAFIGIERLDLVWLVSLVVVAFGLRVATPIYPDWLSHPFAGAPVTAGGLAFPYDNDNDNDEECAPGSPDTHSPGAVVAGGVPVGTPQTPPPQQSATNPDGTRFGEEIKACGFVFDEIYFPIDAAKDLHQPAIDYFDPEPPLAKLLMAPAIAIHGFNPWSWRLTPAISGSVFVGLIYLIARRLRRDRFFAVSAAGFVCFDGLALVESRTGVIDAVAVMLVALFYYTFLLHWQARTRRQWRATLYVMGLAAGLAFGAKLTALAPLGLAVGLTLARALARVLVRGTPALRGAFAAPRARPALLPLAFPLGATLLQAVVAVQQGLPPAGAVALAAAAWLVVGAVTPLRWPPLREATVGHSYLRAYVDVGAFLVVLGAAMLLLSSVAIGVGGGFLAAVLLDLLIVYGLPFLRRGGASDSVENVLWRSAGGRWQAACAHYLAAALLALVVFSATFARYSTIDHQVYRFTACTVSGGLRGDPSQEPRRNGVTVLGHTVVDIENAVRNIRDQMGAGLQYHEHECHNHPYASTWYSWPLMYHPVLFYYDQDDATSAQGVKLASSVSNTGNPGLWWLGLVALLWCCWRMTRGAPRSWRLALVGVGALGMVAMILGFRAGESPATSDTPALVQPSPMFLAGFALVAVFCAAGLLFAVLWRRLVPAVIVVGYSVAWLMWAPGNEKRVLFFYHMLGALPFLALGMAYALTGLRRMRVVVDQRSYSLAPLAYAGIAVILASFVFFYPLWSASPVSLEARAMRLWLDW